MQLIRQNVSHDNRLITKEQTNENHIPRSRRQCLRNHTSSELSLTDAQTALKDVPTGLKFKIVDDSVVPSDRVFRNAWAVDEATLTDGVGD